MTAIALRKRKRMKRRARGTDARGEEKLEEWKRAGKEDCGLCCCIGTGAQVGSVPRSRKRCR